MSLNIKIISLAFTASVLVCCTAGGLDPVTTESEMVDYGFYLSGTKAGSASSTTYTAMLHSAGGNAGEYPYAQYCGSYRGPNTDERAWLTPCDVDSLGVWMEDKHKAGLRAPRGKYYISFVSPAVFPVTYKNDTEYGLRMYRDSTIHPNLYISSPVLMDTLRGNHLKNKEVYDFSTEAVLKQRKSKVEVLIVNRTGSDIEVQEVGLSTYDTCYFNLRLSVLDFASFSKHSRVFFNTSKLVQAEDTLNVGTITLFSYNYDASSAPVIDIHLAGGSPYSVTLKRNFAPRTEYTCTITLSDNPSVTVTAAGWTDHSGICGVIN